MFYIMFIVTKVGFKKGIQLQKDNVNELFLQKFQFSQCSYIKLNVQKDSIIKGNMPL